MANTPASTTPVPYSRPIAIAVAAAAFLLDVVVVVPEAEGVELGWFDAEAVVDGLAVRAEPLALFCPQAKLKQKFWPTRLLGLARTH